MEKKSWRYLRTLPQEGLKDEFYNVAQGILKLSEYIGSIKNDDDHDNFLEEFGVLLDNFHGIKNATESFYFCEQSEQRTT